MTRDRVLCARLPGAAEDHPFGDDVAVFKIDGKMFVSRLPRSQRARLLGRDGPLGGTA